MSNHGACQRVDGMKARRHSGVSMLSNVPSRGALDYKRIELCAVLSWKMLSPLSKNDLEESG